MPEEKILCGLFEEVLGLERVGIDDNFFELGGDSIISIQLASLARRTGLLITPREVVQHRKVEALAEVVRGKYQEKVSVPDIGVGELSTTPIIRWLEELGAPIDRFSQSALLRVPAGLGQEDLTAALQAILDHHDGLRLRLKRSDAAQW